MSTKELTFTEADFKAAQSYAKFVVENMVLKEGLDLQQAIVAAKMVNDFNGVLRKIYSNILELKKVVEAPEASEGAE